MLKYLPLIIISGLFSCTDDSQNVNLQKGIQADTSAKATSIVFDSPQIVDSTHIIIYPLIIQKNTEGSSFASSSRLGERSLYWNLIFFNADSNTQHLLTDKRLIIDSYNNGGNLPSSSGTATEGIDIYKQYIFYNIVSVDYNGNNLLDMGDPSYLYISDKQGNNFRQLSPDNYNVLSWQVLKGTSKIIFEAQKDTDGDKKFEGEPVIPLIVDINTGKLAKETFSQAYINSLRDTLMHTWKAAKP